MFWDEIESFPVNLLPMTIFYSNLSRMSFLKEIEVSSVYAVINLWQWAYKAIWIRNLTVWHTNLAVRASPRGDASCYVEEPTSMKFYSGQRINIQVSKASAAMKFSVLLGVDEYLAIYELTNTRLIVKKIWKKTKSSMLLHNHNCHV